MPLHRSRIGKQFSQRIKEAFLEVRKSMHYFMQQVRYSDPVDCQLLTAIRAIFTITFCATVFALHKKLFPDV